MAKREKPRLWSLRIGQYGRGVTVYERSLGGPLYARVWDFERQRYVRKALRHSDRERAEVWALEEAQRLKEGRAELAAGVVTLGRLLALYLEQHTPTKCRSEQLCDARRVALFKAVFGARRDPLTLDEPGPWEAYLAARRSGAIDARGEPVAADNRRPLSRDRVLERECSWLVWVLAWATRRKDAGRFLLARAPTIKQLRESVTGWPKSVNVRRPVVSAERFAQIRAHAAQVHPDLEALLDLAWHTGRRLSALCQLRCSDYLPPGHPAIAGRLDYGALRWRAEHDKQRTERVAPLNREAQAAVRRVLERRPGIGEACLFPGPRTPTQALSRHVADHWLRRAEKLAELEPLDGSAWHALRRSWATARKHLPAVDVAAAGGWANAHTLQLCYQQADMDTMLTVVTSPAEVREAGRR
jgi:integrase